MIDFCGGALAGFQLGVSDVAYLILPTMILLQEGVSWRRKIGTAVLVLGLCVGVVLLAGCLQTRGAPDWIGWGFALPLVAIVAWRGVVRRLRNKSFRRGH